MQYTNCKKNESVNFSSARESIGIIAHILVQSIYINILIYIMLFHTKYYDRSIQCHYQIEIYKTIF